MGLYVLGHTQLCFFSDSSAADKTESFQFVDPERMQIGAKELGVNVARAGVLLRRPRCRILQCKCTCGVAVLSVSESLHEELALGSWAVVFNQYLLHSHIYKDKGCDTSRSTLAGY